MIACQVVMGISEYFFSPLYIPGCSNLMTMKPKNSIENEEKE